MENSTKIIKEQGIESSKRIVWVDLVKGYAMLFVMLHHVTFTPMVYRTFYAPFFLTAFFVVAGYTFSSERPFGQFFIRKCKSLLIPLFSLGIINILMSQILSFNQQEGFVQQVVDLFMQDGTSGHRLWFIAAMFIACILFYPVSKLNRVPFIGACVAFAIFNILFRKYICHVYLPWHLSVIGMAVFWLGVGYFAKKYIRESALRNFIESKTALLMVSQVFFACLYISCSFLKVNYVGFSDFTERPAAYFLLNGLGTLFLICLCNQKHFMIVQRFLVFIGQNTLFYFAFHGKVQSVLLMLLTKVDVMNFMENYYYISTPLLVVVEAIILILPGIVFKKIFPVFVGK